MCFEYIWPWPDLKTLKKKICFAHFIRLWKVSQCGGESAEKSLLILKIISMIRQTRYKLLMQAAENVNIKLIFFLNKSITAWFFSETNFKVYKDC